MNTQKLFTKDFTLVVIGQIISLFGNAILRFALPLYLLRETGSSTLFGIVTAVSFIPMVVLSLVGGILADRINKRNIMVFLDFFTAALILVFYFLLGKLPIVPLFIVTLMTLYGITGTYQPAVQASIPTLVKDEKLMVGNVVINQVDTLASLIGPVIGGMMFGVWGIYPILTISIVCFTFSAIMEIFIKIPFEKRQNNKGIFAIASEDIKESFHFLRYEKPLFFRLMVILCGINLIIASMLIIGMPVLIINVLKMSDEMLGFSQGAMAFGGLFGGAMLGVFSKKVSFKNSYILLILCSVCVVIMSIPIAFFMSPIICFWVITLMGFGIMSISTMVGIQMFTIIQKHTPSHLIGKVMALIVSMAMCALPIGQAIYGVVFDIFSNFTYWILIVSGILALIISFYSKSTFQKMSDL